MARSRLVVTLDPGLSEQFATPDIQNGIEAIARWTGVLPRDFFVPETCVGSQQQTVTEAMP
jgi:hypothetical protein